MSNYVAPFKRLLDDMAKRLGQKYKFGSFLLVVMATLTEIPKVPGWKERKKSQKIANCYY